MTKMYLVVEDDNITKLVNEVNEQMNINKGTPLGGIQHSEGSYAQAMLIEIKTGDDEVLPDTVRLMDIQITGISRPTDDVFMQKINISYKYKDTNYTITVDNYDSNDELLSKLKVKEYIDANPI